MSRQIFRFPAYVRRDESGYTVRPLFRRSPEVWDRSFDKVQDRFLNKIREKLGQTRECRNTINDLLWMRFDPDLHFEPWQLSFEAGRNALSGRVASARFTWEGLTYLLLPDFDNLLFIARPDENGAIRLEQMQQQAVSLLQTMFRGLRKKEGREFDVSQYFRERVSSRPGFCLPIELYAGTRRDKVPIGVGAEGLMELLGGMRDYDGEDEIRKVGSDLNLLYPRGLTRAFQREDLVERVKGMAFRQERSPFVLIGPAGSGRTSILHEALFRYLDAHRKADPRELRTVWSLDPTRVVTGMSVVGAWQKRFAAILQYASHPTRGLFLDNMVGLLRVGMTAHNSLTLAQVMKTSLDRRDLLVIGEATPEEWMVVQETDRAFSDLFEVVRVPAMGDGDAGRVCLRRRAELELEHGVTISVPAIARIFDWHRAYSSRQALPGGVVRPLEQLAVKCKAGSVDVAEANEELRAGSRLRNVVFDRSTALDQEGLRTSISEQLVGQPEAADCLADVVQLIRSGLADPERPFGAFLFAGPTGVGKTQAAKALARYLFEDAAGLVRFDMNEFIDEGAASRLIGDFHNPEGLLTSRVRQSPFCVLLFDEIEKAHPRVHDLLLQVLGEGRLTDSVGRTVEFTNAIIIMTSNLGAAAAGKGIGFGRSDEHRAAVYRREIEKGFRPEFVNRIDRTVVFRPLSSEDIRKVARLQLAELLRRDGFVRRHTMLNVSAQALDVLARRGFDPDMGGRALKRVIEKDLATLAAERLTEIDSDFPILFDIYVVGGALIPHITPLLEEPRSRDSVAAAIPDRNGSCAAYEALLEEANRLLEQAGASSGRPPATASLSDGHVADRFRLTGRIRDVKDELESLLGELKERSGTAVVHGTGIKATRPTSGARRVYRGNGAQGLRDLWRALDARKFLQELRESSTPILDAAGADYVPHIVDLAELRFALRSLVECRVDRVWIAIESGVDGHGGVESDSLADAYREIAKTFKWHLEEASGGGLLVEGRGAPDFLAGESGMHLFLRSSGVPLPVRVRVEPVPEGMVVEDLVENLARRREAWRFGISDGTASFDSDPWPAGMIVRIYDWDGPTATDGLLTDLKTGTIIRGIPQPEDWRLLLYERLADELKSGG